MWSPVMVAAHCEGDLAHGENSEGERNVPTFQWRLVKKGCGKIRPPRSLTKGSVHFSGWLPYQRLWFLYTLIGYNPHGLVPTCIA